MITAVLDTNVIAAGLVGLTDPANKPGSLLRAWQAGRYRLVVSEPLLAEVERSLHKSYFQRRFTPDQIDANLAALRRQSIVVTPTLLPQSIAAHPEDDLILGTAVSGKAAYLVTGDAAFLRVRRYQDVQLLTPQAFLILLSAPK
jgi:putative PIN family toxin of toxin-antitoxin system